MTIKISGMREPENIREIAGLGVDMISFDFMPGSNRLVQMIPSNAGILPDYADGNYNADKNVEGKNYVERVGVFADDMPQNIITRIYNYDLDCVQLDGDESAVMIDNLKRSIDPDIHKGLKVIKTLRLSGGEDLKRWHEFDGHADMLLFKLIPADNDKKSAFSLIDEYDGTLPFLLGGRIDIEDIENIRQIDNPMFAGLDIDGFETAPALKDVGKVREFISLLREA